MNTIILILALFSPAVKLNTCENICSQKENICTEKCNMFDYQCKETCDKNKRICEKLCG